MAIFSFKKYTAVLGLYVDLTGRMVLQLLDQMREMEKLTRRDHGGKTAGIELHQITREILEDIRRAIETQMVPIGLDRKLNEAAEAYPVLAFLASASTLIRVGSGHQIDMDRVRSTAIRYWPNHEQVDLLIRKWVQLDEMDRVESGWALQQTEIDAAWAAWSVGDSKTAWDIIDVCKAEGGTAAVEEAVEAARKPSPSQRRRRQKMSRERKITPPVIPPNTRIDDTLTGTPPAPPTERLAPPQRRKLPPERRSVTYKFKIQATGNDGKPASAKGYLTVGFYDNGDVGELFIKMDKQGSEVSGFVDSWAIAVSMLLQIGVPLEGIIAKFKGMQFEPSGFTGNPDVPIARSPVDLVCRLLEAKYIKKETV